MKRRLGPTERYVILRYWLLQSAAWQSLPANARALYVELAMRYNGSNNGRIPYSISEGRKALHVSGQTVMRALQLLQDRGFIRCTYKGSFSLKAVRDASEWCLTEYPRDAPRPEHGTKDFIRWQPPAPDEVYFPQKIKTRLSTRKRTLPSEEPSGSRGGSVKANSTSHGSRGGSVKGKNRPLTLPPEEHRQLPGIEALVRERSRSTPTLVEVTDPTEIATIDKRDRQKKSAARRLTAAEIADQQVELLERALAEQRGGPKVRLKAAS